VRYLGIPHTIETFQRGRSCFDERRSVRPRRCDANSGKGLEALKVKKELCRCCARRVRQVGGSVRLAGPSGWRVRAVASGDGSTGRKGSSQVDFVRAGFVFRTAEVLAVGNLRS
jgi:hypothetical protein